MEEEVRFDVLFVEGLMDDFVVRVPGVENGDGVVSRCCKQH